MTIIICFLSSQYVFYNFIITVCSLWKNVSFWTGMFMDSMVRGRHFLLFLCGLCYLGVFHLIIQQVLLLYSANWTF